MKRGGMHGRPWHSAPVRYGAAVLIVAVVALIQRFAVPQQDIAPFVLFFAGVAIVSVYGGRGPGLLASLLHGGSGPGRRGIVRRRRRFGGSSHRDLPFNCLRHDRGHLLRSPTQGPG